MLKCTKEVKEAFGKDTYLETYMEILDKQWISPGGYLPGYRVRFNTGNYGYEMSDGFEIEAKFYPDQDKELFDVVDKIKNDSSFRPESNESVLKRAIDYFVANCKEK